MDGLYTDSTSHIGDRGREIADDYFVLRMSGFEPQARLILTISWVFARVKRVLFSAQASSFDTTGR